MASPSLWLGALALLGIAAMCQQRHDSSGATPIAFAVLAYGLWFVGNDLLNAGYNAAGVFHPMFLIAGFGLGRSREGASRDRVMRLLAVGIGGLAIWGLGQSLGGGGRAHAFFETPNTLATILNMALVALGVLIAFGESRRSVLVLACVIAAALVATLSRGGFISLACGVAVAWLLSRRGSVGVPRRMLILLGAALASGLVIAVMTAWHGAPSLLTHVRATVGSRGELFGLAWSSVGERTWSGIGYLGFHELLEMNRARVPSYGSQNVTYFAHNDYLQTLVEVGVPGMVLLVVLVAAPFFLALRRAAFPLRPELIAALAALATMAIHALGDFPFYVPLCLLLFGLALGVVDRALAGEPGVDRPGKAAPWRVARILVLAVLAVLLIPPPAAEAAAAYGERHWLSGDAQAAAFGFELARRLQPRDWRYHWFAGQFWLVQAGEGNARAAGLADRAFAAAVEANPREPQPLLGRVATQLRFSSGLGRPQSAATLRAWAEHALALAPLNPGVRRDHAAALEQLKGRP